MDTQLQTQIQDVLGMFVFLAGELTILFLLFSYLVGVLQHYIPPERIKDILSAKGGRGYVIAAFLGAITPFCSCSTIPFLKGLLRAQAGFGTMMVFLLASPLISPVIIGLFIATFGLGVGLYYLVSALTVAIVAGFALEKLGFERYVKVEAYQAPVSSCSGGGKVKPVVNKWLAIWRTTWKDFRKVSPLLLLGVSVGSVIYGMVPTEALARYAGNDNLFAIPVAAVIGIPLYVRAEAMIPLASALVAKGMGMGAVMALIIGSAGASLTEVILLKSLFKNRMIMAFLIVVLGMAVGSGILLAWGSRGF